MKAPLRPIVLIVLIVVTGVAQSGRNRNALPSPSPSPNQTPSRVPSASPSPQSTSPNPSPTPVPDRPKFHPTAFIITGRLITEGGKSYWSNDVGYVADELEFMWNLEKVPVKVSKIGKTTRTQAMAQAKRETDSYVVYMEIHETITGGMRLISTVDRIDYVLLMPGTGEVVRQFVVDPTSIAQTNEHGTQLPPRVRGQSNSYNDQLRRCAWEMARVLRYWL